MSEAQGGATAKISVIVPAFKAEKSIEACVRSLQRQDHRNLEILVIDDCSPDRTGKLVVELAANDDRIRLITPDQNVGVHGARRLGMAAATGDLIGFVDADDYVESNMYSTLHRRMLDGGASVAICSAALVSEGRRLPVLRVEIKSSKVARCDILGNFCRLKFGSGVLWNKLYERRVIEEPALLELERGVDASEDYIVNFGAFAQAKAVSLCPEPLYNYVVHASNASGIKGWQAFARLVRAYVVCLEKYAADTSLVPFIDKLYLKQLHYSEYRMPEGVEPTDDIAKHIAISLRRLADVSPKSLYAIIHSLPARYDRLDRALTQVRLS